MPNRSQLRIDNLLSNVSVKYRSTQYIAEEVFPVVPVLKQTDKYRVYSRDFRIPETVRATKGRAREHSFDVSYNSYALEWHSLKDSVTDREAENFDLADLRADTTEELTDTIMRRMEKSVADLITTTNWSLNVSLAAANAFNANTTVSNPIPIFDTAATTIIGNSGMMPNQAVIPRESFIAIKNHVSVLDRIKYTSAMITKEMISGLFDLEKVHVPVTQYDQAAKGATNSITSIWASDKCFVYWRPERSGIKTPSAGYIFKKNRNIVKRWRDEEIEGDWIEVNVEYDPKVVASLTGYLINDTLA